MKNRIKKILKNRMFLCTLTAIIFGTVGVSAATYFPSNDVTYDNTESGLKSKDVQGAIDELYSACQTPSTGGSGILEKVPVVTSGDGLYKDEYEDGRYFYKGTNPNNYVTFNNEQAGWRIVSIEPDRTIKIMRDKSIGYFSWDTSSKNNWARPASLNTYLNSTYYNELNATAQSQIVAKEWSIGAVTYEDSNLTNQINNENGIKWYGKVALITASEYVRSNSNKSICGSFSLNNDNYRSCKNTTWMFKELDWWMLSPSSSPSDQVFYVRYNDGHILYSHSKYGSGDLGTYDSYIAVRPALYLSSKVELSGAGTQNNPYTIE